MTHTPDDLAQWFDALGKCRCGCGKATTGTLRSYYHNSSLGNYAIACAERLIKHAHKKGQFAPDCTLKDATK